MSGGSFNYLYRHYARDVVPLAQAHMEMLAQLRTYGEVARQAIADFEMMIELQKLAGALHEKLSDVMHDVEWHVSCDYGEDQVREGLKKYNEARPKWGDA